MQEMAKTKEKEEKFKYLVIVESPAKAKTLKKILGSDYLIKSSVGHIRDLPSKGLGVDVKKGFEPTYEIMSGKTKVVDELNKYAKKAEKVYLASDPDREGEAIAWHLHHILKAKKSNISRITFNQITPDAVRGAVEHPREIDQHLVDAQQARRILDRLVGYKISPILWRKIGGRSAGRVQSIAVRLICEREEEIRAFNPEEYWSIAMDVIDENDPDKQLFTIDLIQVDKRRVVSPLKETDPKKHTVIRSKEEVDEVVKRIESSDLKVLSINTKPGTRRPKPPFKTSTLQRAASNALGYGVRKTMQVAQQLYEGVKLGRSGDTVGLITYMRTDSQRIAPEALESAKNFILGKWGEEYYPGGPSLYERSKKKEAKGGAEQDAHEAIRPTYIEKTPSEMRQFLDADQYKLYKLIWDRFIASQISPMRLETKQVEIGPESKDLLLRASASKTVFPGYTIVYGNHLEVSEDDAEEELNQKFPECIKEEDPISAKDSKPEQHFTEPPPRYNEASLVKTLEELGIGRPSTYAPTVATIVDRKYVEKLDSKALAPTKLGINVNELLVNHFSRYINVDFTSNMEETLDKISNAEEDLEWHQMLAQFYYGPSGQPRPRKRRKKAAKKADSGKAETEVDPKAEKEEAPPEPEEEQIPEEDMGFIDVVKKASNEIENVVIPTEHNCPKCGATMNLKSSRFGPFLGCSAYPDCKTIVNLKPDGTPAPEDRPYTEEPTCPDCKNESLVIRWGRYGDYISCTTDDCKYTSPLVKKLGIKCPGEACNGEGDIVEKKSRFGKMFYGCNTWSKTKCDVVFWNMPIPEEECPDCGKMLTYKNLKRGDKLACPDTKGCGYARLCSPKDIEEYRPRTFGDSNKPEEENKSVFSLS